MMKKLIIISLSATLGAALLFTSSCKESEIRGCPDVNSITYNPNATVDDGSCEYKGKIVFWYDELTSTELDNFGVIDLFYEVSALDKTTVFPEFIEFPTNSYWSDAPACLQDHSNITINVLWFGDNEIQSEYLVKDINNYTYWNEFFMLHADECLRIKLENPNPTPPIYDAYSLSGMVNFDNQCTEESIESVIVQYELTNDFGDGLGMKIDTIAFSGGGNPASANYTVESFWPDQLVNSPSKWIVNFSKLDGSPVCSYECDFFNV